MFINPKQAIDLGWIRNVADPAKQVQPNRIDFTLDKVMRVDHTDIAVVAETGKKMRKLIEMPEMLGTNPGWNLLRGNVYDGTSDMYVEVPAGVAAVIYTRSTFARNGVLIASGLYDSGYKGQIGFTIYPHGGDILIAPGTRIGQIAFVHSENAGMYTGGWNHSEGTHYTEPLTPAPKGEYAQALERTTSLDGEQTRPQAGGRSPFL